MEKGKCIAVNNVSNHLQDYVKKYSLEKIKVHANVDDALKQAEKYNDMDRLIDRAYNVEGY